MLELKFLKSAIEKEIVKSGLLHPGSTWDKKMICFQESTDQEWNIFDLEKTSF